jgi:hypothetical protein
MRLTDGQQERIDDAIESAMSAHEPLKGDSVCSCGVRNNMDGDVLFGHRVGTVSAAVQNAILAL